MKNKVLLLPALAMMLSFCTTAYAYHKFAWSDAANNWSGGSYDNSGSAWSWGSSYGSEESDNSYHYSKEITPSSYHFDDRQDSSHCERYVGCGSCRSSSYSTVATTIVDGLKNSAFPIVTDLAADLYATTGDLSEYYNPAASTWHTHTDYSDGSSTDNGDTELVAVSDTLIGCRGVDSRSYAYSTNFSTESGNAWFAYGNNDNFSSTLSCQALYTEETAPHYYFDIGSVFYSWTMVGWSIFDSTIQPANISVPGYSIPLSNNGDKRSSPLPAQQLFPLETPAFGFDHQL